MSENLHREKQIFELVNALVYGRFVDSCMNMQKKYQLKLLSNSRQIQCIFHKNIKALEPQKRTYMERKKIFLL